MGLGVAQIGWSGAGIAAATRLATAAGTLSAGSLGAGIALPQPPPVRTAWRIAAVRRHVLAAAAFRRLGLPALVSVEAGALGEGVPAQPLLVGPAQLLELPCGTVLPAAALVDGTSVRRVVTDAVLVEPRPPAQLAVRADGSRLVAAGAIPVGPTGEPSAGVLAGHLDAADRDGVVGWARDPAAACRPARLAITIDGVEVAVCDALLPRPDLLRDPEAGIEQAGCGFAARFGHRLDSCRPHLVEVRSATGSLAGGPVLVDAVAADPIGFDAALALLRAGPGAAATLAACIDHALAVRLRGP